MLTIAAFAVALGLLIAVHEYGHYRVAVACGVKVIRFGVTTFPLGDDENPPTSLVGRFFHTISKPVIRWTPRRQHPRQETEFAIGVFPFGGYVQMLGHGAHEPVPAGLEGQAFRNKPLWQRFAIVAAGPIANLLLATFLYACVNWYGMQEPKAVLASPVAGSVAEAAGLRGGETVRRAGFTDGEQRDVRSFEDLRWLITRGALDGRDVRLELDASGGAAPREVVMRLSGVDASQADAGLYRKIGIIGPWTQPVIGDVVPGSAADKSGLRQGDVVRALGARPVVDGLQLRDAIRASVKDGRAVAQEWRIERGGVPQTLVVTPEARQEGGTTIGRIGAYVGAPPAFVSVRYGLFEGLRNGAVRTWEVSALTLRMMGKMLVGEASLKNLSGPLTIADYAGKSASMGLSQYLVFLALISVSLGVLNLLPLPVLDGGHLMYYLWEGVTGKGVSDAWMERLQRGGVALLLVMMSIALFNDVTRLFG